MYSIFKKIYRSFRFKIKRIRKLGNNIVRPYFESVGIDILSYPARYHMESKLLKYLPEKGFFIEAGATDGYTESNTYYLEKFKNWEGVLVEPVFQMYKECLKVRKKSKVFNTALVSSDYLGDTVIMNTGYIMSTVKGVLKGLEEDHLSLARQFHDVTSSEVVVPARTLTSILEEAKVEKVDFFSLDVEGYELDVLRGLDFQKYSPTYILVECLTEPQRQEIEAFLSDRYILVEKMTKRDYLYKVKEV